MRQMQLVDAVAMRMAKGTVVLQVRSLCRYVISPVSTLGKKAGFSHKRAHRRQVPSAKLPLYF